MPFSRSWGPKTSMPLFTTFQRALIVFIFLGFTVALREKQGETGLSHLVWTEGLNDVISLEDVYTSYIFIDPHWTLCDSATMILCTLLYLDYI